LGADHRAPVGAGQRAGEDLLGDAPDPAAGPAGPEPDERVLHLPGRRRQGAGRAVRHAPADGEADRPAAAPRGAAAGYDRGLVGFLDILRGKRELKQPAADRLFAMSTAYVKLDLELNLKSSGKAAIVFQPLATADFEGIVRDMEEVVRGTGSDTGTTVDARDH